MSYHGNTPANAFSEHGSAIVTEFNQRGFTEGGIMAGIGGPSIGI